MSCRHHSIVAAENRTKRDILKAGAPREGDYSSRGEKRGP